MSMSFYAAKLDGNRWQLVGEETLNVTNSNAYAIAHALGLQAEDGMISEVEIPRFISMGTSFLSRSIGRQDPGVAKQVDQSPGKATFIVCGRSPSYLQDKVMALLQMARNAQALGATHLYAA